MALEQVLRQKLRQEFEFGQASIARDKANLMEGTKTSLWAMQLKLKREAELKERIAAFAVFSKNAEKAKKLSRNLQVWPSIRGLSPSRWRNQWCTARLQAMDILFRHLQGRILPITGLD